VKEVSIQTSRAFFRNVFACFTGLDTVQTLFTRRGYGSFRALREAFVQAFKIIDSCIVRSSIA
jgi:hypothetical protein